MQVALVHTNLTRGGGMEAYLLSLIKGFKQQGDDVTVYACRVDRQLAAELGCTAHQIRPPWPRKIREFRFLHCCNQLPLRQEYDLSIGTARVCSPHVTVCGGVHVETIKHIRRTALFRGVYDLFENRFEEKAFREAPYIMAHSGTIARQIRDHYAIPAEKIKILYPPIDTETFTPMKEDDRTEARAALGIDDRQITFLFVSCGHQRKGLDQLLKAFTVLDPNRYQLLVAGSPIGSGHPTNVRYIGYMNNLRPVYSAVDFTVLPSYYEPFGLVVPESIQCGTPVIVTQGVGAAELLSAEEGILLEDNSHETLVRTMTRLDTGHRIAAGFAQKHGLTIGQHIELIKKAYT